MKKTCMLMMIGLMLLLISGCMGMKEQAEGSQQVVKEEKGPLQTKDIQQKKETAVIETKKLDEAKGAGRASDFDVS